MIEVSEAVGTIIENTVSFGTEKIPLNDSLNRILKEDWFTDRPLPPYDRIAMDGIAINYATYDKGARQLPVVGMAAAGMQQQSLTDPDACLEAMTGAILPLGCDTIIPYEHIEIKDGHAHLQQAVTKGQNIHFKGIDRNQGELVVRTNTQISAAEIGVGASIGKTMATVARLPKIMVISTGDELVDIDEVPLPHQIRRSNVYRIVTTLRAYGIQADTDHLTDDRTEIALALGDYLNTYDVIILSGGVSKGKFDFVPEVLMELSVEKLFHKIKQRPGKPFWFGQHPGGCTVFGFPGNPVSSFLCYHRYFKTWLEVSLSDKTPVFPRAVLAADVHFKPDLTYFLEVKISYNEQGQILAYPVKGNGSGDLANLSDADAFIELPRGQDVYLAGGVYSIYRYR